MESLKKRSSLPLDWKPSSAGANSVEKPYLKNVQEGSSLASKRPSRVQLPNSYENPLILRELEKQQAKELGFKKDDDEFNDSEDEKTTTPTGIVEELQQPGKFVEVDLNKRTDQYKTLEETKNELMGYLATATLLSDYLLIIYSSALKLCYHSEILDLSADLKVWQKEHILANIIKIFEKLKKPPDGVTSLSQEAKEAQQIKQVLAYVYCKILLSMEDKRTQANYHTIIASKYLNILQKFSKQLDKGLKAESTLKEELQSELRSYAIFSIEDGETTYEKNTSEDETEKVWSMIQAIAKRIAQDDTQKQKQFVQKIIAMLSFQIFIPINRYCKQMKIKPKEVSHYTNNQGKKHRIKHARICSQSHYGLRVKVQSDGSIQFILTTTLVDPTSLSCNIRQGCSTGYVSVGVEPTSYSFAKITQILNPDGKLSLADEDNYFFFYFKKSTANISQT